MKSNILTKLILAAILFASFLIHSPIRIYFSDMENYLYSLTLSIFNIAIFVCMLIVFRKFFGVANFFKVLGINFAYLFINIFIIELSFNTTIALIYQILSPLIAVAIIVLAFKLATKAKLKISTPVRVLSCTFFGISTLFSVVMYIEYLITSYYLSHILSATEDNFFNYLSLFSSNPFSISVFDKIIVAFCLYALVFLAFIAVENSLPEPPPKKVKVYEDEQEPPEAPFGTWRCMGCGEFVPDEKAECDCGYKKGV